MRQHTCDVNIWPAGAGACLPAMLHTAGCRQLATTPQWQCSLAVAQSNAAACLPGPCPAIMRVGDASCMLLAQHQGCRCSRAKPASTLFRARPAREPGTWSGCVQRAFCSRPASSVWASRQHHPTWRQLLAPAAGCCPFQSIASTQPKAALYLPLSVSLPICLLSLCLSA
jgi:hypothetical protein